VRALKAGADLALFASGDPGPVVDAVTAAIKSGRLPRAQAEASALRVLELKRQAGLAPAAP
jgi:beta-glucosidase-like glycosyl hydrolase